MFTGCWNIYLGLRPKHSRLGTATLSQGPSARAPSGLGLRLVFRPGGHLRFQSTLRSGNMYPPRRSLQDYALQPAYRRPWSPEPFDPNPNMAGPSTGFHARREPSDASVQALDLADYAAHLRASQFPPRPIRYDDVVPGSIFPSSASGPSRSSMPRRPGPSRRPFSLPPASLNYRTRQEELEEAAIDVSSFPPWSRDWYTEPQHSPKEWSPYDDLPPPSSPFLGRTYGKSPFDPAYIHQPEMDPYDDPPSVESLKYAYGDNLSIPSLPPSYTSPMHADRKANRLRMLEAEFAPKPDEKLAGMDVSDDDDELRVGSVDANGRLISPGPKRRKVLRILQTLILLASTATIIYGLLVSFLRLEFSHTNFISVAHTPYGITSSAWHTTVIPPPIRGLALSFWIHIFSPHPTTFPH